jgi:hypothetical protein
MQGLHTEEYRQIGLAGSRKRHGKSQATENLPVELLYVPRMQGLHTEAPVANSRSDFMPLLLHTNVSPQEPGVEVGVGVGEGVGSGVGVGIGVEGFGRLFDHSSS